MINGYAETSLVNNKKSVVMNEIAKEEASRKRLNCPFWRFSSKPDARELKDFKEMINKLKVEDFHKDIVWTLLNSHEFMFVN